MLFKNKDLYTSHIVTTIKCTCTYDCMGKQFPKVVNVFTQ
jgi:hypothetical protein